MRPILSCLLAASLLVAVPLPIAAAADADLQTTTLAVENMTCSMCRITVGKALKRVDGVVDAKVDLKSKSATVRFDPTKTDVTALTRATTNAGYPSSIQRQE